MEEKETDISWSELKETEQKHERNKKKWNNLKTLIESDISPKI